MIKMVIEKLMSGRFLFTIGALLVFMYLSTSGKLPVDKVHDIILIVLYAYFSRNDRGQNGNNKQP